MGASLRTSPRPLPRAALSMLWATWTGDAAAWTARVLLFAAATALFLSAAGTIEASFTVTPSYALAVLAVIVGAPAALRGWLRLPAAAFRVAAMVAVVYLTGVLIGSDTILPSQEARSAQRDLVYLFDLLLGLGVVGLAADLARDRASLQRLVACLCVGGLVAASYAIYQWPAQHFDLPLADVNNALNSDGFTRGHRYQGSGLFGWERVRGTFKEPLYLASYLAAIVPLCIGLAMLSRRTGRLLWLGGTGVVIVALILTVSSLAWVALGGVMLAVVAAWTVLTGQVRVAGFAGALLVLAVSLGPLFFVDPSVLSGFTGRSPEALRATSQNRLDAWRAATDAWSAEPILGYGPGQSAIQLAYRPSVPPGEPAPLVLGSAQGLWAASLVDAGLIGLFCWIAFFGTLAAVAARSIVRRPSVFLVAASAAAGVAVLLGNMAGDRLDLRVWIALELLAAAICSCDRESAARDDDAPRSAE